MMVICSILACLLIKERKKKIFKDMPSKEIAYQNRSGGIEGNVSHHAVKGDKKVVLSKYEDLVITLEEVDEEAICNVLKGKEAEGSRRHGTGEDSTKNDAQGKYEEVVFTSKVSGTGGKEEQYSLPGNHESITYSAKDEANGMYSRLNKN
jgi:hypothetical protein